MMKRAAFLLLLGACGGAKPVAHAVPPAPAPTIAKPAAKPAASASATPVNATIPVLTPEVFKVDGKTFSFAFPLPEATIITKGNVVGYLDGDKVEWIAKVAPSRPNGPNIVGDVFGHYLDSLDIIYYSASRSPQPVYVPLTGKGQILESPGATGTDTILGTRIGDSTIVLGWSMVTGEHIETVRGPKLTRKFTNVKQCPPEVLQSPTYFGQAPEDVPAVSPTAFAGSRDGSLVLLGAHCLKGMAAEIWDPNQTTSRIVDLSKLTDRLSELDAVGDGELWARGPAETLTFAHGAFTKDPPLEHAIERSFVGPNGDRYATSDNVIYRLANGAWERVATIAMTGRYWHIAVDRDGGFWLSTFEDTEPLLYRLRETGRAPANPPCESWFVQVLDFYSNPPNWTYPATRKQLASFPDAAKLHLVEYDENPTHVGVAVADHAQGQAVLGHLATTAPDVRARLYCHVPKKLGRTIDVVQP